MPQLFIRRATATDLENILQLFRKTIQTINSQDYSPEQIKVWGDGALKKDRWLKKIEEQYFLIAELSDAIAGFASITTNGYLDFMYVSQDHQRKGVAKGLYTQLENFTQENGVAYITADVSITARPFFERQNFIVVQQQEVIIDGVFLTNFKMKKLLSHS